MEKHFPHRAPQEARLITSIQERKSFLASLNMRKRDMVFLALAAALGGVAIADRLFNPIKAVHWPKTTEHQPLPPAAPVDKTNIYVDIEPTAGPQDTASYEEEGIYDTEEDDQL
jgi:hypothetical protein